MTLDTANDFSTRVSLLDLPMPAIPAPTRVYSLLGECLATVKSAVTVETLAEIAATYNTVGSAFSALSDTDKQTVRDAWRAQRALVNLSAVWSALWGFLANADLPAPIAARGTVPTVERVEANIADTLAAIAREIPTVATVGRSRSARALATRIVNQTQAAIAEGEILATYTRATGDGAELRHGEAIVNHLTRRDQLMTVLTAAGFASLAPKAPSAKRHLGEAMRNLNDNQLIARNPDERPKDIESRWIVGSLDLSLSSESLGERELTVDLVNGDLVFSPADHVLVPTVRDAYERRVAGETYNTTSMITWLRHTLRTSFYARKFYDTVYVPAGSVDRATALVDALAKSGVMGRSIGLIPKASDKGLRLGLLIGFTAEIEDIEREVNKGERGAESILGDLFKAQKSLDAFTALLGEEYTADVKAKIATLHTICADRLDSTRQRFAALDLYDAPVK